jgi:hypothetical protein
VLRAALRREPGRAFEVPWLSDTTWAVLRASWQAILASQGAEKFGKVFFSVLYEGSEGEQLRPVFAYAVCSAGNIGKIVEELIRLFEPPSGVHDYEPEPGPEPEPEHPVPPRISTMLRAVARLARRFGVLRFAHIARIKDALNAAAKLGTPAAAWDDKQTARAWQAFTFACASMVCPRLLSEEATPNLALAVVSVSPAIGLAIGSAIGSANLSL